MKKIITLLSVILFIASCSNKFSLQKRKYNKGFYFASNHSKGNQSFKTNQKPEVLNTKSYCQLKSEQQNLEVNIPNVNQLQETNSVSTLSVNDANHKLAKENTEKIEKAVASNSYKSLNIKRLIKPIALPKAGKGGSDTNLIVLVILSLFPIICLIAVYLKDGKDITLNFWIDLLLHLTFIGMIIFALLVVLDVVNLA